METDNTESKNRNSAHDNKKDPPRVNKICEFMTYSGREALKRLRTNIILALPEEEKKCRVIGVTSAQPSEGKSTVSINLAYSLAELGKNVLLIDGDMRRPSLHAKLGIPADPGLSSVLFGTEELRNAVRSYKSSANSTRFDLITSGAIPDNPSELLNSKGFKDLIQAAATICDYIVIDLPPVNAVIDAINVSKSTDGMVIVIRENHCPKFVLNDCIEQLRYAKVNILGFVMNGCIEGAGKRYQYNQNYYKYYK